jgi:hypothetical protein
MHWRSAPGAALHRPILTPKTSEPGGQPVDLVVAAVPFLFPDNGAK